MGRRQKTGVSRRSWPQLGLAALLLVAVCASSLAVVYATHRSRTLANELAGLELDAERFEMDWHRLLLEQGVWAEQGRVLSLAQEKLGMQSPDPSGVVVIRP